MKKSTRQPTCTCPACKADYYTAATGAFYCIIDREWSAYSANQFIGAYEYQAQALEALAVYDAVVGSDIDTPDILGRGFLAGVQLRPGEAEVRLRKGRRDFDRHDLQHAFVDQPLDHA